MISDAVYEHALAVRDAALARLEEAENRAAARTEADALSHIEFAGKRMDELVATEAERDAALARVAELEQELDAALDEIRGIVRYLDSPDFDDRERLLMVRAACADGLARAALGDPS